MTERLYRGLRRETMEWCEGHYLGYPGPCIKQFEIEQMVPLPHVYDVIPETVGQYVRNDVNGNRAFEGDIIQCDYVDTVGVIRFGEYRQENDTESTCHVGFYVEWHGNKIARFLRKDVGYWLNRYPVVGNIHDNPKLLEVK